MSDIGVWRQENGIVVRLWGSERLLTDSQARELMHHICRVVWYGHDRSVSSGYQALCDEFDATDHDALSIDLEALGLAKPKPVIKRRSL